MCNSWLLRFFFTVFILSLDFCTIHSCFVIVCLLISALFVFIFMTMSLIYLPFRQ